jgi:hypothetical protein
MRELFLRVDAEFGRVDFVGVKSLGDQRPIQGIPKASPMLQNGSFRRPSAKLRPKKDVA